MSDQKNLPTVSRRDVVQLALAAGIVPLTGGWAAGQSRTEVEVLMTNALMGPGLREVVENEANVKITDAPFRTVTDSISRLLAPGGTTRFSVMHAQVEVARNPILGEKPGDEKIAPLDLAKIPNAANIADVFKDNYIRRDGKTYSVPGTFGFDTVIYNASEIPEADPFTQSWGMLFEDKYAGRIAWFDSALHMFLCAGLYLGNKAPEKMQGADLEEVQKFLVSRKKNVRTFWTSFAQGANLIGSGEVLCAYGPVVMRASLEQRKFPVGSAWCKEGVLSLVSGGFIPKDAPHKDLAHGIINAMIGPEYAKRLTKAAGYLSCSRYGASLISPEDAKRAGYGILDGTVKHHGISQPANFNAWVEAWSRVKSA
ncbi:MAG: extracellular solute-binding protein [Pseudolabrys sp.]|nr:extracellular solute-binding protein [Pseudolabrys sp.]MBV9956171.1 extracellular solute-binding protein [Pseudolabrys sp.]